MPSSSMERKEKVLTMAKRELTFNWVAQANCLGQQLNFDAAMDNLMLSFFTTWYDFFRPEFVPIV